MVFKALLQAVNMIPTINYNTQLELVELIDQTRLPLEKSILRCTHEDEIVQAIKTMQIRGAPAIGVAAAYGVFLGLQRFNGSEKTFSAFWPGLVDMLASTRPTAVNLFWALDRMRQTVETILHTQGKFIERLAMARQGALKEAQAIQNEDIAMCRAIGRYGAEFLKDGQTWITHCNAGALATAGYGTALGVFRAAQEQGKKFRVFVDETRPLLQGSRLTAWELREENIDATLICDNVAGSLMANGKIQAVVVGADRITAHGYVANKIGTYPLAVLASFHNIPFYVAAPASTFDLKLTLGRRIAIEERDPGEVRSFGARPTAPFDMPVFNPAFDVTPPELVSAIFTNVGVLKPPFSASIREKMARIPTQAAFTARKA